MQQRSAALLAALSLGLYAPISALADAASPEALYKTHCAACHEGNVSKAPPLAMMSAFSPSAVLRAMNEGIMQSQAQALTPLQRQQVAEFMTGKSLADVTVTLPPACENTDINLRRPPRVTGWGVNHRNQRFFGPELTSITIDNIAQLEVAWAYAFPDATRARSQPTIAGDTVFIGSQSGQVLALDRQTGCLRWSFTTVAEVRTGIVVSPWDATDTNAQPMAFFGDLVGNVYAVNARTGELIWRDRPSDHPSLTITAAPALHNGRLYVPMSSLEVVAAADPDYACCSFRGGIASYDAQTGAPQWLSHTIPTPPVEVGRNPVGTPILAPSGAPVWGTPVVDTKRQRLYLGTGESYSSPAAETSDAILALDLATGAILWHFQATAGDAWNMGCESEGRINCPEEDGPDYDFGAATLLMQDKNGEDILIAGQKSGAVFGIDPDDGSLRWQNKLGRGGIQGGVHFAMATDGQTLYVPMSDFYGGPRWPGPAFPGMFAVDPTTGDKQWYHATEDTCGDKAYCDPGLSAAPSAIVGGIVAGAMDGQLRAYARDTGTVVWQFNSLESLSTVNSTTATGGSFGGAAGPVFHDDMMFITSGYGLYFHMPGNALIAFKLASKPTPQPEGIPIASQ
jgi:polyvinyl alcohol dehydrogenase (cytochrome)